MSKKKKILFGIMFWIIQLTWGAVLTYPGLIVSGILILCGCKVHKNGCSFIVEVGGNWGGLEIGACSICGNYSEINPYWFEHTRRHEFGHNLQQLVFGPFQLFVVSIPSAIRYWYQRIRAMKKLSNVPYDEIWFEYTASKYGYKYINLIEDIENFEYKYIRRKDSDA